MSPLEHMVVGRMRVDQIRAWRERVPESFDGLVELPAGRVARVVYGGHLVGIVPADREHLLFNEPPKFEGVRSVSPPGVTASKSAGRGLDIAAAGAPQAEGASPDPRTLPPADRPPHTLPAAKPPRPPASPASTLTPQPQEDLCPNL